MFIRIEYLAVMAILATSAYSQPLQIRSGLNYSTMSGWRDVTAHGGFYAGIQKDFQIGNGNVSFQPGIFYSLQTFQYDTPKNANTSVKGYIRYTLHYAQLPMMFNFRIREHFGILAGPQAGLLAHSQRKTQDGSKTTKDPISSSFNSLALSVAVAPYIQVDENFKIELRLLYDVLRTDNFDGHMMLMQLGFVYVFNKNEAE